MVDLKPNESEVGNKEAFFFIASKRMSDDFQLNSAKIRSGQNSVGKFASRNGLFLGQIQLSLKEMEIFSLTLTNFDSRISI